MTIGVPPADYWPYDANNFDTEPTAFAYRLAKPFDSLRYFRLDSPDTDSANTWHTLQSFLAAGFPVAFGFAVPSSLTAADTEVPYRPLLDSIRGGQAALAIGYHHHHFGRGRHALLVRTSWGNQWGDNGNAWLPAAYVRERLARDFWTVVSGEWGACGELSRPAIVDRT